MTHRERLGHSCDCKEYNGGQCYNCINGAHEYCEACGKKNAKQMGVKIIIKESSKPEH